MTINLKITEDVYYRTVISLFKSIYPFSRCSPRELDILAELLYLDHLYSKTITDIDIRNKLLFDYDTKIKIIEKLNISLAVLDNNISALRKKNIIIGKKLANNLKFDMGSSILFSFEIYNNDTKNT